MMECKVLTKDNDKVVFILDKINPAMANTLRRYIADDVKTLAIEEIEVAENSSALFDEIIAHRLGLVPLKTDLKSYNLKEDCKCKGKGCAQCQLTLTLKAKGPCTVYSGDIVSKDPKVKPAFEKMPIVKLRKDQELKMSMTANLGQGGDHVKFSPGLFYYKGFPTLKTSKESNIKQCVNDCKDVLIAKGNNLEIKDLVKWNEAHEEMCEKNDVEIIHSEEKFICTFESWGQLPHKEVLTEAVKAFDKKLDEFEKAVKKLK